MTDIDDDTQDQASHPDPFQNRDDGFFNPKRNEPKLPQDYDTPAAAPHDVKDDLPRDYPQTDTGLETGEVYDEGTKGATDIDTTEEQD